MKSAKIEEKLDSFINKKAIPQVEDKIILETTPGEYELYNKYYITKTPQKTYVVTIKNSHVYHVFYKLKNAAVWCTYDKLNKIKDADNSIELDVRL